MHSDPFGIGPTTRPHELLDRVYARVPSPTSPRGGSASVRSAESVTTLAATTPASRLLTCDQCGAEFVPRRRRKDNRFCRSACRAAWHGAGKAALRAELAKALARANQIVHEL